MELSRWKCSRSPLYAAIGFLFVGVATAGSVAPAHAQATNAADLCTPDVMRLCQDFVPDADRIVRCLKSKRRQVSAACRTAMKATSATEATAILAEHGKGKKKQRARH
jgi:hypothetical protein